MSADRAGAEVGTAAARAREEVQAAVRRLEDRTASLRREHEQWRQEAGARRAAWDAAARAGTLGPVAQTVQDRVDAGLTTWAAVLDGRDTSPSAERARAHVRTATATWASAGADASPSCAGPVGS